MSKQVLKQVSPLTSVWVDKEDKTVSNKKQTSIDFLIEQIEIILKLNNVQLSAGYTIHTILPIIEKLKATHKQEIMEAFEKGYKCGYTDNGDEGIDYYNETFGGDK